LKHQFILPAAIIIACAGCSGHFPELGVSKGFLSPCPSTPNCVNSQASEGRSSIEPISYTGTKQNTIKLLVDILENSKRVKIITIRNNYIRASFTSAIFRFIDDVEFYFPEEPIIHVRSASRIGYSDMGANRRRIESIREKLPKKL